MEWINTLIVSAALGLVTFTLLYWRRTKPTPPALSDPLGNLHIYVDGATETAQHFAAALSAQALGYKFKPHVVSLEHFSITEFKKHDYCVIICSTLADGPVPPQCQNFIKWITKVAKASHQDLSKLAYCVFAVDSDGSTSHLGLTIDTALAELNAKRIVDVQLATCPDEARFADWCAQLWTRLPSLAKVSRRPPLASSNYIEVLHHIPLEHENSSKDYPDVTRQLLTSGKRLGR